MIKPGNIPSVSLNDILDIITEDDILYHYFGISKLPCLINSPLRKDEKPSFSIFKSNNLRIRFKDFASGDEGGIIDMLMLYWNVTFKVCLSRIYKDLPSMGISGLRSKVHYRKSSYNGHSIITCTVRNWRKHDLEYWGSYGISLKWLKFGEVYPISSIIINKNNNQFTIPAEKYAYVYVERKDNIISLKIYQPLSTSHKWSNSNNSSVWNLWRQLPANGDKLIITSSRKDALCLWENTGIPATSLQGEGYLPKSHVVKQLTDRFENIYVLYDNDFNCDTNHGREFGKKLADTYGFKQIEIPLEYKSKDPSDLYHNHGKEVFIKCIKDLTE